MSSVQQVINLARWLGYTTSSQYDDTSALEDFNNVYHDLENDIVRYVDEDYYYDVQYTDLMPNQCEYVLPLTTSTISWFKKIKDISVKYHNDGYNIYSYDPVTKIVVLTAMYSGLQLGQTVTFINKEWYVIGTDVVSAINSPWLEFVLTTWIPALTPDYVLQTRTGIEYNKMTDVSTSNFTMDENRYRNNTPTYSPMYKIADYSIWVYPVGTQYVANGLKIYTIRDQTDLLITAQEKDIKLPWQYHNTIAYGMVVRLYQRRGMIQEKNDASQEFDKRRDEMSKELSNRNASPVVGSLPPLNYLS